MQTTLHKQLCQLGDISRWLHPLRRPQEYAGLNRIQLNRLLSLHHQFTLPHPATLTNAPGSDLIACWGQLPRVSLLAGSLGLIGAVHTQRLQSLYQVTDLSYITALSQQCFPIPTTFVGVSLNEALLCERGWLALCQAFSVPAELAQAGRLALPPLVSDTPVPLTVSLRVCLTLNKLVHYVQEIRL